MVLNTNLKKRPEQNVDQNDFIESMRLITSKLNKYWSQNSAEVFAVSMLNQCNFLIKLHSLQ